ncbi:MAG: hypothetical protein Q9187_004487, partial [Circinaria calcarea]
MNPQAPETADGQEAEDIVFPLHEEPENTEENAEWKLYNLLSLDGGGIRGYWSLLALQKLMGYIAEKEENEDDGTLHSFSPEGWPDNVSQVPRTQEEKRQIAAANTPEDKCRAYSNTRRYLPCHYFDHICGSSTGASDEKAVETPYLIRSYDHNQRTSPNQSRRSTRRGTMRTNRSNTGRSGEMIMGQRGNTQPQTPINYENAQDFEIWEVARAATAAPFYFEPFEIRIPRSSGHLLFTDGGFSTSNNPTREGTQEIEEMHGTNSMGVVVSIGTARHNERPREKGILPVIQKLKGFVQSATDPEVMHLEMKRKSYPDKFPYYRLNDPGGTSIELDEWKPKRGMFKNKAAGSETIKAIKDAFSKWAGEMENIRTLEQCAADLVDRRRARTSNRTMWER